MKLSKYSMGVGDRFNHQAKAQLSAIMKAKENGIDITPVWNKSFREHEIIHSNPSDTRIQADDAVKKLGWKGDFFVDADHVNIQTVGLFIEVCDFFTLDVADYIGMEVDKSELEKYCDSNNKFIGELELKELSIKFQITEEKVKEIGKKYLFAVKEAGKIYNKILESKGENNFIVEVSMDETDSPQSPIELFFILSAIAEEGIPVQTIAPKFSGRFNKGVDYVGDVELFKNEFQLDLAVIKRAIEIFQLPDNLKLSVHSGSDKFSIYKPIKKALKKFDSGLHIKTAGTTWLEELIGLAEAGGDGLSIAKKIYRKAFDRYDELCGPYKTVIDIDKEMLPYPKEVDTWSSEKYATTLRHDLNNSNYNLHFRQLLHVAYKVAAEMNEDYLDLLVKHEKIIAYNVLLNIYQRHIENLFIE
jgi:tagaturonate epimerase